LSEQNSIVGGDMLDYALSSYSNLTFSYVDKRNTKQISPLFATSHKITQKPIQNNSKQKWVISLSLIELSLFAGKSIQFCWTLSLFAGKYLPRQKNSSLAEKALHQKISLAGKALPFLLETLLSC
jgi:hypothetical protein